MVPFICNNEKEADFKYRIMVESELKSDKGTLIFENNIRKIYINNSKYFVYFSYKMGDDSSLEISTVFDIESKEAQIYVDRKFIELTNGPGLLMSSLDIDLVLLLFNRIIMHASVVEYQNQAILFSGPSEIGKSTQANLWKKYMNADILNGDRATIDISKDITNVYGSPYAGSSKIYRNESAPIKAIILLKQGEKNSIRQLVGMELYRNMFPRFSLARWDDKLSNISMNIIEEIISRIPVYELTCLPDEEAVKLVCDTVF
ncbi:MAG: hypothetical protein V8R90_01495 [Eubacterium sp.]|nr:MULTISPECIES: hypothetical protein [unclassified Eubacterium (in: firmicutes)]